MKTFLRRMGWGFAEGGFIAMFGLEVGNVGRTGSFAARRMTNTALFARPTLESEWRAGTCVLLRTYVASSISRILFDLAA